MISYDGTKRNVKMMALPSDNRSFNVPNKLVWLIV